MPRKASHKPDTSIRRRLEYFCYLPKNSNKFVNDFEIEIAILHIYIYAANNTNQKVSLT